MFSKLYQRLQNIKRIFLIKTITNFENSQNFNKEFKNSIKKIFPDIFENCIVQENCFQKTKINFKKKYQ
jgi:hypothetical protein